MNSARNGPRTSLAIIALLLLLWISLSTVFPWRHGDFLAFYIGGKIALAGEFSRLHDQELQREVQREVAPYRPGPPAWVRPHVYSLLVAPVAALPLDAAYFAWVGLQAALLIAVGWWAWRRFGPDAAVLLALFPMAILGIEFGQDPAPHLALCVLSYRFFEKGRDFTAGYALGWMVLKPHLVVLMPLAMLVQRRWRLFAGFAAGGASVALSSFALAGVEGMRNWAKFLGEQQTYFEPRPERMINFRGLLLNMDSESAAWRLLLSLMAIACVIAVARGTEWWRGLAAAQAGSLLIAPHVFPYDATLLLLPALLVYYTAEGRLSRAAAVMSCTPLPHLLPLLDKPYTAAPALLLVAFLAVLTFDSVPRPAWLTRRVAAENP